jgi:hypothetical protein
MMGGMANTGTFCVLAGSGKRARELAAALAGRVRGDVTLKDLDAYVVPEGSHGPCVLIGTCDRLTPRTAAGLFAGLLGPGEAAFIVDSTYGDGWEPVP